ncbi:MAG: metallophosphoesterase family protein [Pseudonocardiaceae bacterium]
MMTNPASDATSLEFTEEMKGYITFGEPDEERGFRDGKASGTFLMFHLTIKTDDVERFIADPAHPASATGWVKSEDLSGQRPVEHGLFNLFVDSEDPSLKKMRYRLHFSDGAGEPLTLAGFKDIRDDPGSDLWSDTTTLYVRILRGHVEAEAGAEVLAAGILNIYMLDFARQLTTFRVHGSGPADRTRALTDFGQLFLGNLWDLYRGKAEVTLTHGPRTTEAPGRPRSDCDLGFTRQRPVRWFSPAVLANTGQRVLLSAAVGDFLDKRELQQALGDGVVHLGTGARDVWIDYVSDTGDGFDPTYSIAWLTAQRELQVSGLDLPRGELLVLGGDEVYPAGTPAEYENRFKGPYKASLPYAGHDSPTVVAIPGNHDWYDGLTNFMRVFCSADEKWIGGRRTVQSRSYFAVRLTDDWWLWGIDIQFDAYIDDPQIQYFKEAARSMGAGTNLILCTAKPSWTDVKNDPQAFRNLAYLEARVIRPAGIRLMLSLSGDTHHYARYAAEDGTLRITAGGGGAFLHPTHHLDDTLSVPTDPAGDQVQRYDLEERYPEAGRSRRLSLGALRLPWTNPAFMVVPATIYVLLGWTFRSPVAVLLLLVVLAGLIGFASPSATWSHGRRRLPAKALMGVSHLAAQLAVGALVGVVAVGIASFAGGWLSTVVLLAVLAGIGGLAGTVVMGAYLALCCALLRSHGNEAFSCQALTGYKNFLRLHIGTDGVLRVYAIGLDAANRRWRFDHGNPDGSAPWLAPEGAGIRCHLIEKVVIDPGKPAGQQPVRAE